MKYIFKKQGDLVTTESMEMMLQVIGGHIQRKLLSENIDNISIDEDSYKILQQMIQDRRLYEEVKDHHKDFLKKESEWKRMRSSTQINKFIESQAQKYQWSSNISLKYKNTYLFIIGVIILTTILILFTAYIL